MIYIQSVALVRHHYSYFGFAATRGWRYSQMEHGLNIVCEGDGSSAEYVWNVLCLIYKCAL